MSSSKYAEPFRIKAVEMLKKTTPEQRRAALEKAAWNVFQLKAEDVYIDCLTDSGTSAMSNRQWAALMMGDESYAGCESFYRYQAAIQDLTGFSYVVPTHQGRAADNLLGRMFYKGHNYKFVVTNMAFDSTRGAAMNFNMWAEDLLDEPGYDSQTPHPFKGNMSPQKLEDFIKKHGRESIGMVIMTITCNTNGKKKKNRPA